MSKKQLQTGKERIKEIATSNKHINNVLPVILDLQELNIVVSSIIEYLDEQHELQTKEENK